MRRTLCLWAALHLFAAPLCFALTVANQYVLRRGINYDLDSENSGDLHLVFRSGGPNQNNDEMDDIYYGRYVKSEDGWAIERVPTELIQGVSENSSSHLDRNQPTIGNMPVPDPDDIGSWLIFGGRFQEHIPLTTIGITNDLGGAFPFPVTGGGPFFFDNAHREIKKIYLTVSSVGTVWVCWNYLNLQDNGPGVEGIYCNSLKAGAVSFGADERAIQSFMFGVSGDFGIATGPNDTLHVVSSGGPPTNNDNWRWTIRQGVNAGNATPGNVGIFGIDGLGGKPACLPTNNNNIMRCAIANVFSRQDVVRRDTLFVEFRRDMRGGPSVNKLGNLGIGGFTGGPGCNQWNNAFIDIAKSPAGKEAIAYQLDADPVGFIDLAVVLTKPEGVEWPTGPIVDANNDGLHDRIAGTSQTISDVFRTQSPPAFHVFEGQDGMAALVIAVGNSPAVSFSGEDLFAVYAEVDFTRDPQNQNVCNSFANNRTIALKMTFDAPRVPEVGVVAAMLLLFSFSLVLLRAARNRGTRAPQRTGF